MKAETAEKLINLSRASYDKIAADFDKTRKKEIWPEMREFTKDVFAGAKILDAGCGNGRLLEAFQERNVDYLGIDSSGELINLARNNYPGKAFLEFDLIKLDTIKTQELKDKKFDYIFCLAVLQHIPGQELRIKVLKSLREFLDPNGELVISNWNLWQSTNSHFIFEYAWKKIIGQNKMDFGDIIFPWKNSAGEKMRERYYHAFTKRGLIYLAKKAGFKNIKAVCKGNNYWLILR